MILKIIQRLGRGNYYIITGMDTHTKYIFHVTNSDTISSMITHYFIFNLLPMANISFDQYLVNYTKRNTSLNNFLQFIFVVSNTASSSSQTICYSYNYRVSYLFGDLQRFRQ